MSMTALPRSDVPPRKPILHQQRVAWDLARLLIAAAVADLDTFAWHRDRLAELLGESYRHELVATRGWLAANRDTDARSVETSRWRARLDEAMRHCSDLTEDLYLLQLRSTSRR